MDSVFYKIKINEPLYFFVGLGILAKLSLQPKQLFITITLNKNAKDFKF